MKAFMIIVFAAFTTVSFAQSKATTNNISKEVAALKTNDKNTEDNALVYPSFQGGQLAMSDYLSQNLKYPYFAKENGVEGTVVVQFYVRPDGSIEKASIKKSLGYGCDEAALKVVENMPSWIPAQFKGQSITKKIKLPISFSLR
jgi:TonB family protein